MAELQSLPRLLLTFSISSFYGTMTSFNMLWNIIRRGPRKFFYTKERNSPPPILQNPKLGQHGFLRLKDVRLHYVASGPEDKPLMLMIHGFPEFWYSWRHQMAEFNTDYRTVAIDMRGYNESEKPPKTSDYVMSKLTGDVKETIEALGYEKCVLVAHDWGGAVAWQFTVDYPDMVDRLIVCNIPHGGAFVKHISSSWSQFLKSWYMFYFQLPYLPEIMLRSFDYRFIKGAFTSKEMGGKQGSFTEEDVEAFKYSASQPGALTATVNYYRAAMRYKPAPPKNKAKIARPVLLVWGTRDGALDMKMAEMSGQYCEDFTLQLVEGASHWVQQEEPQRVNKYMREFLARQAIVKSSL